MQQPFDIFRGMTVPSAVPSFPPGFVLVEPERLQHALVDFGNSQGSQLGGVDYLPERYGKRARSLAVRPPGPNEVGTGYLGRHNRQSGFLDELGHGLRETAARTVQRAAAFRAYHQHAPGGKGLEHQPQRLDVLLAVRFRDGSQAREQEIQDGDAEEGLARHIVGVVGIETARNQKGIQGGRVVGDQNVWSLHFLYAGLVIFQIEPEKPEPEKNPYQKD